MMLTRDLAGLQFKCNNVINFWIVEHISVKTKETFAENIVGQSKNDLKDSQYKVLGIMVLILILRYIILAISLLGQLFGNIYNRTIMTMMRFTLTFNLDNIEIENNKYKLLLDNIVPYIYKNNKSVEDNIVILEKKAKSCLTLFSPQIC